MSSVSRLRPITVTPKTVADLASRFPVRVEGGGGLAPEERNVTGIASDNRDIVTGEVFAALPGFHVHGAKFAPDAAKRGAAAILTDNDGGAISAELGVQDQVPVIVAEDLRQHFGPIAAHIYDSPAANMTTFAVTGTNGKTTTVYLLQHILMSLGLKAGLIGTVEMKSGIHSLPAKMTTPDAADLQAILATMYEDGVQALAMEVSSHALALRRTHGVIYDVAGFTNLTQDHFDFHNTFDEYFAAKALLFTPEHSKRGVVVVDDEWGQKLADIAPIPITTLHCDFSNMPINKDEQLADWVATNVRPHGGGSDFTLQHRDGRELHITTELPGRFNVQNSALALAMVLESGVSIDDLNEALTTAGGLNPVVPGRMEVIAKGNATEPRVIVDFAHNTGAMAEALNSLRHGAGKVSVLFGAAGERDQGKRPSMGAAAVEGADIVILTDDDPHGEDPANIRADVRKGAEEAIAAAALRGRKVELLEIPDRREAIHYAVKTAQPGDTVLLAGRGHETVQQVGTDDILLDDRQEARAALAARSN